MPALVVEPLEHAVTDASGWPAGCVGLRAALSRCPLRCRWAGLGSDPGPGAEPARGHLAVMVSIAVCAFAASESESGAEPAAAAAACWPSELTT